MTSKEIFTELPDEWRILEGAITAKNGYRWISNGKSRFGGEYKQALLKLNNNEIRISYEISVS